MIDNPVRLHPTAELVQAFNASLERESAKTIIGWAVDTFGPGLCLTTSMTDAVLIDLATAIDPSIEVVFLDTGYHFRETLDTVEVVRRRYDLNLRIITGQNVGRDRVTLGVDGCCSQTKVRLLDAALAGRQAWMSGLRRCEAPTRANVPILALDRRGLVKVNPIARWADEDVRRYISRHDVPVNPLLAQGYRSVGCWPCTQPTPDGAHQRAGRWAGTERIECGIHT